jgi:hypothetical protein
MIEASRHRLMGAARRPLALGRGQAPADPEAEDHAPARHLIQVRDLLREHDRVTQR